MQSNPKILVAASPGGCFGTLEGAGFNMNQFTQETADNAQVGENFSRRPRSYLDMSGVKVSTYQNTMSKVKIKQTKGSNVQLTNIK